MIEGIRIHGMYEVYRRWEGQHKWVKIQEGKNTITNEGLELLADGIMNRNLVSMLSDGHFFWSNGTGTPSINDTVSSFLTDGEGGNKEISTITYYPATYKIKTEFYLLTTEGNTPGTITRMLLANGSDASAKSYASWKFSSPINKTDDKELYFVHYLTFSR